MKEDDDMCSQSSLKQLLSEVCGHAKQCYGADLDSVILYGSHARGDADEESDVDIMILVQRPASELAGQRKEWNHFGTDLDLKYNVLTSFKLQDTETFYRWKDALPFYQNVIREGVRYRA